MTLVVTVLVVDRASVASPTGKTGAEAVGLYPLAAGDRQHLVQIGAASVLNAAGGSARMLVVGTRGLGGFRGLRLGSTSHA